jgi:tRNA(Arg) A34 adenosine deaminase TadA
VCTCRRAFLMLMGGGLILAADRTAASAMLDDDARGDDAKRFVAEAFRMRREAIASGDQAYGAVVVRNQKIIGYGPSRVVVERDADAHAERVAMRDAQRRLGTSDLSGAVMYSTSRPCAACETAAASARLERMFYGADGADAGRPRPAIGAQPR